MVSRELAGAPVHRVLVSKERGTISTRGLAHVWSRGVAVTFIFNKKWHATTFDSCFRFSLRGYRITLFEKWSFCGILFIIWLRTSSLRVNIDAHIRPPRWKNFSALGAVPDGKTQKRANRNEMNALSSFSFSRPVSQTPCARATGQYLRWTSGADGFTAGFVAPGVLLNSDGKE